eukprot:gene12454-15856_t
MNPTLPAMFLSLVSCWLSDAARDVDALGAQFGCGDQRRLGHEAYGFLAISSWLPPPVVSLAAVSRSHATIAAENNVGEARRTGMQPGKRLIGKVALVTGGASGIGAATARLFALHGASVVLTDSNAMLGKAVEKEIVDTGGTATFATQDVRHEARWAEIVADTEKAYGRLDILCNIAGISGRDPKLNIQTSLTAGPRL